MKQIKNFIIIIIISSSIIYIVLLIVVIGLIRVFKGLIILLLIVFMSYAMFKK